MKLKYGIMALTLVGLATTMCTSPKSEVSASLKTGAQKENMDESVSPKEDFYQYACGGWQKNNPLKDEYSRYGSFDMLGENNKDQLLKLVNEISAQKNEKGSIAQKIADLYAMGMDSARLNEEGAAAIQEDLKRINESKRADFSKIIAWMHTYSSPFFGVAVMSDLKNSDINILYWGQGGLGLGDKDYYVEKNERNDEIMAAYKNYIVEVCKLSGYDSIAAERVRDNVLNIENELAAVAMSRTEQRDLAAQYNIFKMEDVAKNNTAINWKQYFEDLYLPYVDSICVMQPKSMAKVDEILNKYDEQIIKDYLAFNLISSADGCLSDDFRTAAFNFSKVISGAKQDRPRWKRALAVPDGLLGEALGQLYVEKYFPAESKQRMIELVNNLKESLSEHITTSTWMSDATKARAQEKLSAFTVKIGYPDKWKDYSAINIDPEKYYWQNVKEANLFHVKDSNEKCGKPVDRAEWGMTPQTVNAYYNPSTNEICFPAGILQNPFFAPDALDADVYGAIGVVIGHEMTHGFDDMGRNFDKKGDMVNWWTDEDAQKFNALADKLVAQFDSIVVLGDQHANGRLTLGENIADQGGLRIAYSAYMKTKEAQENKTVDGLTPAQRFYLSYAHVWADNIRDAEILRRTTMDEHSLGRWRVNATLKNIDTFYDAFDIQEGDAMYLAPEDRVVIW